METLLLCISERTLLQMPSAMTNKSHFLLRYKKYTLPKSNLVCIKRAKIDQNYTKLLGRTVVV